VNIKYFSSTATLLSCLACASGSAERTPPAPISSGPATPSPSEILAPSEPIASSSASTAASGAPADGFQLLWEDAFDTVDAKRWTAQTHSWEGNLAQFTRNNVSVVDGRLQLSLTPSGETEKPYDGVEYRSVDAITYGKVEASMRFAKGSGVVSSLVLIYTPWPPDDWNELDIECLGNTEGEVQFNHMVNIPPADPASEHLQFPEKLDLGFDPTAAFHTYTIEWLPSSVRFLVDGVVVHEPTEEISRLVLPQNILLTIWASDAPGWAGPIDDTTAPTSAEVDWIRVYSYAP
jgi:endo-1,3-1,4-beta-glycanase ExoK